MCALHQWREIVQRAEGAFDGQKALRRKRAEMEVAKKRVQQDGGRIGDLCRKVWSVTFWSYFTEMVPHEHSRLEYIEEARTKV